MSRNNSSRFILVAVVLMLLTACQQLGLQEPQTVRERLAYGYSQVSAVRKSLVRAIDDKVISPAQARKVLADTDTATTALDSARDLDKLGNATGAVERIEAALRLTQNAQKILSDRGVK